MNVERAIALPTERSLKVYPIAKGDLAGIVYPTTVFDTALPQEWVNRVTKEGFDPRSTVVWGYPKGSIFGLPLPLTAEAEQELERVSQG